MLVNRIVKIALGFVLAFVPGVNEPKSDQAPPPPVGWKIRHVLQAPYGYLHCIAISPDGKLVAAGVMKEINSHQVMGVVIVWDAASGKSIREFQAKRLGRLESVLFLPDGSALVAVTGREVFEWDIPTGTFRWKSQPHSHAVAISDEGDTIAWSCDDDIVLTDRATGQHKATLPGGPYLDLRFSPDGRQLVAWKKMSREGTSFVRRSNDTQEVTVYEVTSKVPKITLQPGAAKHCPIAFSPDSRMLVMGGSQDGNLQVWNLITGVPIVAIKAAATPIWNVAFSPDGKKIAAPAVDESSTKIWDTMTWTKELELSFPWRGFHLLQAFSPDGSTFIVADQLGGLTVWDVSRP